MTYETFDGIQDKTLQELIVELDKFFEIYKYKVSALTDDLAGIKAKKMYLTANIDEIYVNTSIVDNELTGETRFAGGTTLNKYLDIKDNHCIDIFNTSLHGFE
jgi:hypothetical protein